jgi:hypothetical protein
MLDMDFWYYNVQEPLQPAAIFVGQAGPAPQGKARPAPVGQRHALPGLFEPSASTLCCSAGHPFRPTRSYLE